MRPAAGEVISHDPSMLADGSFKVILISWCSLVKESCSHSPYGDVEDVAAHWAGHSHVPQTFPGHNHAGDQVGDGRASCQDGQAHDLLRDAHCLTHLWKKKYSCLNFY